MAKSQSKWFRGAKKFVRNSTAPIRSYTQALSRSAKAQRYKSQAAGRISRFKHEYRKEHDLDIGQSIKQSVMRLYAGAAQNVVDSMEKALSNIQVSIEAFQQRAKHGQYAKVFQVREAKKGVDETINSSVRVALIDVYKGLDDDPKVLRDVMANTTVQRVMKDILSEAQELAPIDKRYVGNYLSGKRKGAKIRQGVLSVPVVASFTKDKETKKYATSIGGYGSVRELRTMQRSWRNKQFHLGGGQDDTVLSREKQRYIQRLGKEDRRLMWFKPDIYDSAKGTIYLARMKKKMPEAKELEKQGKSLGIYGKTLRTVATLFHDGKHHGGEEELRRSGEFDKEKGIISFNPMRLGTDYDYSLEQHENTTYKHAAGKSAFFLLKAYSRNKMRLIDAVKKALGENRR